MFHRFTDEERAAWPDVAEPRIEFGGEKCQAQHGYMCSLSRGHEGDHTAYGLHRYPYSVWDDDRSTDAEFLARGLS